jgi:hypothetical protein
VTPVQPSPRVSALDVPLAPSSGRSTPVDAPASAVARPAPAFVFDPLEPRRTVDETADQLTERVAEVLREQAWREGVDLT